MPPQEESDPEVTSVETEPALSAVDTLVRELATLHPEIEVWRPSAETGPYDHDAATARSANEKLAAGGTAPDGPAVALPADTEQVQALVRTAAAHGVTVVPRGPGSGLSGGASATADQLVLSTERLNRILEVSPLDEVAVVEPGVINAELNAHLQPHGLFYAPDPASFEISSIGGNIATNAGGLRCAKYGVTGNLSWPSTSYWPTAASSRWATGPSKALPGST